MNHFCGANAYSFANFMDKKSQTKHQLKGMEVYRPLQDSYRPFTFLYAHCLAGSPDHTNNIKTECPCCQYNLQGNKTASFDACFGAVGKKHKNKHPTKPFLNYNYLLPDLLRDVVVTSEDETLDFETGCDIRATRSKLAKSGYYDGLNETGLCGSVCKHGIPLFFLNIRFGGEKMIFASKILDELLKQKDYKQYLLKYDSICTFETWRVVIMTWLSYA